MFGIDVHIAYNDLDVHVLPDGLRVLAVPMKIICLTDFLSAPGQASLFRIRAWFDVHDPYPTFLSLVHLSRKILEDDLTANFNVAMGAVRPSYPGDHSVNGTEHTLSDLGLDIDPFVATTSSAGAVLAAAATIAS